MGITPDLNDFRLDRKTVYAGVLVPIMCLAVDKATFGFMWLAAPGAILTLCAGSILSLLLSSLLDPTSKSYGVLAGALCVAAMTSIAIAFWSLQLAATATLMSAATGISALLVLAIVGLTPVWSAWVYFRRARLAIQASTFSLGDSDAFALGLSGAGAMLLASVGSELVWRLWLTR